MCLWPYTKELLNGCNVCCACSHVLNPHLRIHPLSLGFSPFWDIDDLVYVVYHLPHPNIIRMGRQPSMLPCGDMASLACHLAEDVPSQAWHLVDDVLTILVTVVSMKL